MPIDWTINIGHILTIVTIAGAVVISIVSTRLEVIGAKDAMKAHEARFAALESEMRKQTEILVEIARQDVRLSEHERRLDDIQRRAS